MLLNFQNTGTITENWPNINLSNIKVYHILCRLQSGTLSRGVIYRAVVYQKTTVSHIGIYSLSTPKFNQTKY